MAKAVRPKAGRPKGNDPTVYVATRIPESLNARMLATGQKMDLTPAWILRNALKDWLDRMESPPAKG